MVAHALPLQSFLEAELQAAQAANEKLWLLYHHRTAGLTHDVQTRMAELAGKYKGTVTWPDTWTKLSHRTRRA